MIISTLLINRYGWTGFDPLASIFIAVLIFASVVPLVVDSGKLLVLDMGEEKEAEVRKALTVVRSISRFSRSFSSCDLNEITDLLSPCVGTPSRRCSVFYETSFLVERSIISRRFNLYSAQTFAFLRL